MPWYGEMMPVSERFSDLARLVAHGRALREVAATPEPAARRVAGSLPGAGARLGLLAGSFNPPTIAHQTLALAGVSSGGLDGAWYALSTRTVDKEVVTGAGLEDRLLLLDLLTEDEPGLGTILLNRGLYVDQARIVRAAFPTLAELVFLVGFDKIVQIFDPKYYDDRDAALEALFGLASFLVAPRGSDEADSLAALLARPENRRYAGAVRPLDLPPELREVASSSVREGLAGGAAPDETVPPVVSDFIAATGVYADEARYARRRALIDAAIEAATLDPDADLAAFHDRLRAL
jgi:nicotinic acid mononucleotide adenylyltransferase